MDDLQTLLSLHSLLFFSVTQRLDVLAWLCYKFCPSQTKIKRFKLPRKLFGKTENVLKGSKLDTTWILCILSRCINVCVYVYSRSMQQIISKSECQWCDLMLSNVCFCLSLAIIIYAYSHTSSLFTLSSYTTQPHDHTLTVCSHLWIHSNSLFIITADDCKRKMTTTDNHFSNSAEYGLYLTLLDSTFFVDNIKKNKNNKVTIIINYKGKTQKWSTYDNKQHYHYYTFGFYIE